MAQQPKSPLITPCTASLQRSDAVAPTAPPHAAARPLFQQLLREAATLSTPVPSPTASHPLPLPSDRDTPNAAAPSGDPGPADPGITAPPQNNSAAPAEAPRATATRLHAQCSRLLGLPDIAAANCGRVPPLLRLPQLLPRLLSDAAAAAAAAAAPTPHAIREPTATATARPGDNSTSAASIPSGSADRQADPPHPDPAAAAACGGSRQRVAPEATAHAAAALDSNHPTDGDLPELLDAQGSYTAALCGLRALLSVATLRGHADTAARWCMHAMHTQANGRSGGEGQVDPSPGRPVDLTTRQRQPERRPGTDACIPAALAQISDTGVHERLWHAMLMHAAAAAPECEARPAEGGGERPGAAGVLGVLWRDGTARALPEAQHVTFLLQLQTRPGRPLPPQAQLLLLLQVCLPLDLRLASLRHSAAAAALTCCHSSAPACCCAAEIWGFVGRAMAERLTERSVFLVPWLQGPLVDSGRLGLGPHGHFQDGQRPPEPLMPEPMHLKKLGH